MTTLAEKPSLSPNNELMTLPAERISPVASAIDRIAKLSLNVADRFEANKRSKLDTPAESPSDEANEIFLSEASVEEYDADEATAEKDGKSRNILRNVGSGAIGALRGTGEFAIGAGIIGGRKLKESAVVFGTRVDSIIEKADTGYNTFDAKLENFADSLIERKDLAIQHKVERRAERAEQKALADYDKMRDKANAENERFDAKAEKVKQRAAEALIRKDARKQKWAARKAAVIQAFSTAKNATVNFGLDTAAGAKNIYETASTKTVEVTNKGVDNILFGASDAAETISAGIDKTISAGERLRIRAGEIRSVGAAAIEGARVYGGAASQQARDKRSNTQ